MAAQGAGAPQRRRRTKGALEAATEKAVKQATDAGVIGPLDVAAVQAMLALARKIDAWDVVVRWAQEDAGAERGARPAVPQNDNVSLSAYLKYCDQLGLTPAGRGSLKEKKPEGKGGKLGKLTPIPRPAAS